MPIVTIRRNQIAGRKAKEIRLLMAGRGCAPEVKGDRVTVTVPELREYEIISVEME